MLDLERCPVEDVSSLVGCPDMAVLHLKGTNVTNLAPLANLAKLHTLNLENTFVADVSPLAGLKQLRTVHLAGSRVGGDAADLLRHVPNVFCAPPT